jgi:hypothetical protein
MRKTNNLIQVALLLAVPLLAGGCKTVVRENIISTIETGIGVTLAENPKTEMYEAKVGYIRSQFYSVPTGKTVENENDTDGATITTTNKDGEKTVVSGRKDLRSNKANVTPQLVSGIQMKSKLQHLLVGMDVSESFAVGEIAVMSPAAVVMYFSQIENTNQARSAALAVQSVAEMSRDKILAEQSKTKKILNYLNADPAKFNENLKKLAVGTALDGQVVLDTIDSATLQRKLDGSWSTHVDDLYKNLPEDKK